MSGSFTMDGANIQSIILILVVIGLGAYVYLEVRKLKAEIASLKKNLQTVQKSSDIPMPPVYPTRFQQPFAKGPEPRPAQASAQASASGPFAKSSAPEQNMNPVSQEKSLSLPESDIASIEGSTELSNLMMSEEEFDDYDPSYTHEDIDKDEDKDNISEKDACIDEKEDIQLFQKPKENPYKGLSVSELKSKLTEMDLPTSGNKSKLVQRILDNE